MPDPFIFAIVLTVLTFILAFGFSKKGATEMVGFWWDGLWANLTFGMQMCLILVTGSALATSRPVQAVIRALSGLPKSGGGAAALVAFATCVAGLIHWGLGAIVGAILAREVALAGRERGLKIHFPLLGAAAYMGLLVWHGGLSGSAPLQAATAGKEVVGGLGIIPVADTLGSPLNIVTSIALVLVITIAAYLFHPRDEEAITTVDDYPVGGYDEAVEDEGEPTPARRIENSRILAVIISAVGLFYVGRHFVQNGFALDLNIVNGLFLFLGLVFQGTPIRYVRAITEGTKSVAGIILMFPFYFGIQGLMAHSGLVQTFADAVVSISGPATFPILTFLSAGVVNIFVPSGGGQWVVQGPVMITAAKELGVEVPRAIMAISYGDEWTNMIQPFWAIPVLGITRLKAGEIIGYAALTALAVVPVFFLALLFAPV
jgi:short-chain fatty acids transporter